MRYRRVLELSIVISLAALAVLSSDDRMRSKNRPEGNHSARESSSGSKSTASQARLGPPLDLEALTREADLIVIGRVNSVESQPLSASQDRTQKSIASLQVKTVLKGQTYGAAVKFEFPDDQDFSIYPQTDGLPSRMFFLHRNAGDEYSLVDPYHSSVIASSVPASMNGSDLDRVVAAISEILTSSNSTKNYRREAINALRSARTALATRVLRRATRDGDVVVRLQALSALLSRNDISELDLAERTLLHPSAAINQQLLINLSSSVESIRDDRAIPALLRLLRSHDTRTRIAAAAALRQMRLPAAVEGLVLALEDSDIDVRYQAVVGLGEMTGQYEWTPSIEFFRKDEQRYLNHWKDWARNGRSG